METCRRIVKHTDTESESFQRIITLIEKHCPKMMRLGGYLSKELETYLEKDKDFDKSIKNWKTKNENKSKETD